MKNKKIDKWFIVLYVIALILVVIGVILCARNDMAMGPIVLACGGILFIRTTQEIRALRK